MALGTEVWKDSDGKAVDVDLLYTTAPMAVAYADGWLGITVRGGNSGDGDVLEIARQEYHFEVPAALDVSKGDIVRIDLTQLGASHQPPADAYNKSAASATNLNLFKATSDKNVSTNVVSGILLAGL